MLVIPVISVLFIFVVYQSIDMFRMMKTDFKQAGNYMVFRAIRWSPFKYDKSARQPLSHYQCLWFENHFPYYDRMSMLQKKKFHSRVAAILETQKFKAGKVDFPLTPNKEQFVVSVLVYMTLGLDRYDLPAFENVIVFPQAYFNKHSQRYHKGETNMRGAIVFSWKDFTAGFTDMHNNLNLAIHEFAHALSLQAKYYPRYSDVAFTYYLDLWHEVTSQAHVIKRIKSTGYFRNYAFTNEEELFAVATECFFETPETFRSELPYLYSIIAKIFNQDLVKQLVKSKAA